MIEYTTISRSDWVTQKGNSRPHVHTATRHDQQKGRYRHVLRIHNPSKASSRQREFSHTSMHPTHFPRHLSDPVTATTHACHQR